MTAKPHGSATRASRRAEPVSAPDGTFSENRRPSIATEALFQRQPHTRHLTETKRTQNEPVIACGAASDHYTHPLSPTPRFRRWG